MTDSCIALPTSPDTPLLLHGDCLDLLARLPDASVHAVVTDPPAGIGFMGKPWDSFAGHEPRSARGREVAERLRGLLPAWAVGFVVFLVDVWVEVDRVMKPGGFVCAWALPKTADLAGLAGRAVGWEVHDSLLHLFGGGMPKGLNIGKALDKMAGAEREGVVDGVRRKEITNTTYQNGKAALRCSACGLSRNGTSCKCDASGHPATEAAQRWDGWNTQLAPGHEQWLLFRKPTPLTYAANVLAHCTGALHVDACRIPRGDGVPMFGHKGESSVGVYGDGLHGSARTGETAPGSWPRNVLLTCGGEECPAVALDRQSGTQRSHGEPFKGEKSSKGHQGAVLGVESRPAGTISTWHDDSGGASRFFTRFDDRVRYQAKASDRGAGLRSDIVNGHPTHKHVGLMRWLVRLLAATAETTGDGAAIVLDPFAGSFTTGVACVAERVRFIGIERDASSFEVGRARVLAAIGSPVAAAEANEAAPAGAQLAML